MLQTFNVVSNDQTTFLDAIKTINFPKDLMKICRSIQLLILMFVNKTKTLVNPIKIILDNDKKLNKPIKN